MTLNDSRYRAEAAEDLGKTSSADHEEAICASQRTSWNKYLDGIHGTLVPK